MADIEQRIGYIFEDKSLLDEALTHSSYANEHGLGRLGCNERLEFLGDAVLSAVVADYLYRTLPDVEEGELTKQRAAMVCESALAMFARDIDLGKDMHFGKGELKTHGNERDSILSDCFEAVIAERRAQGALYGHFPVVESGIYDSLLIPGNIYLGLIVCTISDYLKVIISLRCTQQHIGRNLVNYRVVQLNPCSHKTLVLNHI